MKTASARPISKTKLLALLKKLDWRGVEAALQENPELRKIRGEKGENLLHLCCSIDIAKRRLSAADSIKTAGVLLAAGFDINAAAFKEGTWEATPLWCAIARGKNLELAQFLIDRGADPNHCLWAASFNDSPAAIRLLVKGGAEVDEPGEETPLLFAVKWSHFASAKVLLELGAEPNTQDALGKTPLHYMLKKRSDPRYLRLFLERGARLNIADNDGGTAGEMLSRMRAPEYRALADKYL